MRRQNSRTLEHLNGVLLSIRQLEELHLFDGLWFFCQGVRCVGVESGVYGGLRIRDKYPAVHAKCGVSCSFVTASALFVDECLNPGSSLIK